MSNKTITVPLIVAELISETCSEELCNIVREAEAQVECFADSMRDLVSDHDYKSIEIHADVIKEFSEFAKQVREVFDIAFRHEETNDE